jgi:hypothetical protein
MVTPDPEFPRKKEEANRRPVDPQEPLNPHQALRIIARSAMGIFLEFTWLSCRQLGHVVPTVPDVEH